MPVDLSRYPSLQAVVDSSPAYRAAWLSGKWPPVARATTVSDAQAMERILPGAAAARRPAGVGTELSAVLAKFGIRKSAGCNCGNHAATMDRHGIEWCESHMDTILGWLRTEAQKRGMPFMTISAKLVVLYAIRRAKAKRNATTAE